MVISKHSCNLPLVIVDSGTSPCKSLTNIAIARVNGNTFLVQCILNLSFHFHIFTMIEVVPREAQTKNRAVPPTSGANSDRTGSTISH